MHEIPTIGENLARIRLDRCMPDSGTHEIMGGTIANQSHVAWSPNMGILGCCKYTQL